MFIYEKNGSICVTFKGNKPVEAPEYVITIDKENETVYVNGQKFVDPVEEPVTVEAPVVEPAARKTTKKSETVEPVVVPTEEPSEEPVTE